MATSNVNAINHLNDGDQQPLTLEEAMSTALRSSIMVSVLTGVIVENLMDQYKLKGHKKYLVIATSLYMSNVATLYLKSNGY